MVPTYVPSCSGSFSGMYPHLPRPPCDARFAQDSDENRFSVMGHQLNFAKVSGYLPGNGALLQAVAAMAAGFDDSADSPGFPADWGVRHEGLHPLP